MRYFFNVHMDGQEIADLEGRDFDSFDDAHSKAAQLASELVSDFSFEIALSSMLEMVDEDGETVLTLPFHASRTLH